MKLMRRDAIAALAAAGVAVGAGGAALSTIEGSGRGRDGAAEPLADRDLTVLVAAAEVLYPTPVEGVRGFVTGYLRGRATDSPAFADGVTAAAGYLDDYAEAWYDQGFVDLDDTGRLEVLRTMNADTAAPDPAGSDVERIRYYVVNELLFALYASPTGGRLVGIENPPGYPGGLASYRRGRP